VGRLLVKKSMGKVSSVFDCP
jgi:hypothetical protein